MSYASKYHIVLKEKISTTVVTYRIDLLENGFVGSSTEKRGTGDDFDFGYDGDPLFAEDERQGVKKIWVNSIQSGHLDLILLIQDATDEAILTDIVNSDDKQFQLSFTSDGVLRWTGFVIPDLIQYSEGPYPYGATITAKDLHLLESEDYATNTAISYKRYAPAIADILNSTGLNLGLFIYDEWTAANLTGTDDYFNQAFIDEYQLQDFTSFSEGDFEPISKMRALKELIPPEFVLRQYNDKWQLFDLSHFAQNAGIVTRYEYDSAGTKTGKTTALDLTTDIDRVTKYLLKASVNKPYPGMKRLEMEYNHKTSIQNILFESEYIHDDQADTSRETIKVSDVTERKVTISGSVEVTTDTNPGSFRTGDAKLIIFVDDFELSLSTGSWGLNEGEQTVSVSGTTTVLTGSFFVSSADIPVAVDESTLTIELRWATVSGEIVQQVKWLNFSCELVNGSKVDNGAAYNFRLEQTGNFSMTGDVGTIIFGQGPDDLSNSALRYFSAGATFELLTDFRHVGGVAKDYEQFVLTNIMNMQRNPAKNIAVDLLAIYDPVNVIVYETDIYFFLIGSLKGRGSRWNGEMVQLNWITV